MAREYTRSPEFAAVASPRFPDTAEEGFGGPAPATRNQSNGG